MANSPIPCGLFIEGKQTQVPLKDSSVTAIVHGYLVGLESILKYSNDGDDPIEVVFRFPVEESFAVVGLEAVIAGRRIKAQIREKEEARQMYDDAIASGFSAALAEEKSGDIFSISLGNLPPKEKAELHLKLAGELPIDAEGGVRFTLPSVLKPRYTPVGSTDPLAKVGGEGGQVQQGSAPAVFTFNMEVAEAGGIDKVTSPTHTLTTETKGERVHVSLGDLGPLDKDLVVLVNYRDPHEPKAVVESDVGAGGSKSFMGSPAVMLNFFPKFTTTRGTCEFIFIVDRSGSMRGSFIKSASETLILFLKSIPPGSHFNIIGFGSSYESLFPKSVPYNQENLDEAVRHAETVQADLGGTELLGPLRHVNQQPLLEGLARQMFVLTDGSVSNTHACIEEVKKNVSHARCFTFGIGSGASTELVRGLARAGNGTAEFVQSGERLQPKVISSLKRALQPSIADLKIEFSVPKGFDVAVAPSKLPTLFSGDKTVIYGIFRSKKELKEPLTGTATLYQTKGDLRFTIPFQVLPQSDGDGVLSMPIIHHLAAKSLIKDWQAGEGLQGLSDAQKKETIIKLSIESSVVSSHTAYVAIDEDQDKPIEGAMKIWDVTAMMATKSVTYATFGGGSRLRYASAPRAYQSMPTSSMAMMGPPPPPPMGAMAPSPSRGLPPPVLPSMMVGGAMNCAPPPPPAPAGPAYAPPPPAGLFELSGPPPPPPPSSMTYGGSIDYRRSAPRNSGPTDTLSTVVSLQQAEGFWRLDTSLASVLSQTLQKLEAACPVECKEEMRMVWATVLVLVFLETKLSGKQDEWELVAMKAEFWLGERTIPPGTNLDSLKAAAKTCF